MDPSKFCRPLALGLALGVQPPPTMLLGGALSRVQHPRGTHPAQHSKDPDTHTPESNTALPVLGTASGCLRGGLLPGRILSSLICCPGHPGEGARARTERPGAQSLLDPVSHTGCAVSATCLMSQGGQPRPLSRVQAPAPQRQSWRGPSGAQRRRSGKHLCFPRRPGE